jgi:anti-anti-sigma factor
MRARVSVVIPGNNHQSGKSHATFFSCPSHTANSHLIGIVRTVGDRRLGEANREGTTVTSTQTRTDLALVTVRHETDLLVWVQGRLDIHTKDLLVGCARSWAADGVRTLVVDLAELSAIDGFGVAALLRCRRVMRARAGTLRVVNVPGESAQTFVRTGMYEDDGANFA